MFDHRGADAEPECTERTISRGMAVAGRDHHAGQNETLLRRNHMLDALALVLNVKQLDSEIAAVLLEVRHLQRTARIRHLRRASRRCRIHVIDYGKVADGRHTLRPASRKPLNA